MKHHFNSPGLPKRRLIIYTSLLFVTLLLGVLLNLSISSTPPPTDPVTAGELRKFKASLQGVALTQKH